MDTKNELGFLCWRFGRVRTIAVVRGGNITEYVTSNEWPGWSDPRVARFLLRMTYPHLDESVLKHHTRLETMVKLLSTRLGVILNTTTESDIWYVTENGIKEWYHVRNDDHNATRSYPRLSTGHRVTFGFAKHARVEAGRDPSFAQWWQQLVTPRQTQHRCLPIGDWQPLSLEALPQPQQMVTEIPASPRWVPEGDKQREVIAERLVGPSTKRRVGRAGNGDVTPQQSSPDPVAENIPRLYWVFWYRKSSNQIDVAVADSLREMKREDPEGYTVLKNRLQLFLQIYRATGHFPQRDDLMGSLHKHLYPDLYRIRVTRGRGITWRMIYSIGHDKQGHPYLLVLNVFKKKATTLPIVEIQRAANRHADWLGVPITVDGPARSRANGRVIA